MYAVHMVLKISHNFSGFFLSVFFACHTARFGHLGFFRLLFLDIELTPYSQEILHREFYLDVSEGACVVIGIYRREEISLGTAEENCTKILQKITNKYICKRQQGDYDLVVLQPGDCGLVVLQPGDYGLVVQRERERRTWGIKTRGL